VIQDLLLLNLHIIADTEIIYTGLRIFWAIKIRTMLHLVAQQQLSYESFKSGITEPPLSQFHFPVQEKHFSFNWWMV